MQPMTLGTILFVTATGLCATSPAQADFCHPTPIGVVCAPGYYWHEGREWREREWQERQREERREREREREREHYYHGS